MQSDDGQSMAGELLTRRCLLALTFLLLVCLGVVDWCYERRKENRYDSQIVAVSRRYGVEPALVKAVVWRESRFNPRVRGRVGEIGLMQVRALTAQEWAQSTRKRRSFEGDLFAPETNLEVGTWYLSKLLKRYANTSDPIPYALADYNSGRSNVLRWNKGAAQTNSAAFLSQITFPSTQDYIRAILSRSPKYRSLNAATTAGSLMRKTRMVARPIGASPNNRIIAPFDRKWSTHRCRDLQLPLQGAIPFALPKGRQTRVYKL